AFSRSPPLLTKPPSYQQNVTTGSYQSVA
ncbi:uncharacterized protein METZ01_LOCUS66164, partial [marine metagenome]